MSPPYTLNPLHNNPPTPMRSPERERRTPEQDEEEEAARQARYERELDRADYLRDEQKDREMEERETRREKQS